MTTEIVDLAPELNLLADRFLDADCVRTWILETEARDGTQFPDDVLTATSSALDQAMDELADGMEEAEISWYLRRGRLLSLCVGLQTSLGSTVRIVHVASKDGPNGSPLPPSNDVLKDLAANYLKADLRWDAMWAELEGGEETDAVREAQRARDGYRFALLDWMLRVGAWWVVAGDWLVTLDPAWDHLSPSPSDHEIRYVPIGRGRIARGEYPRRLRAEGES